MHRSLRFIGALLITTSPVAAAPESQDATHADLIPRAEIFGNPTTANVTVSPDGRSIAFVRPVNGVLNVWVGPAADPRSARPVTRDTSRGITRYLWSRDGASILYFQDTGGNENFQLFATDVASGRTRDLTGNPKVRTEVFGSSYRKPGRILVGINDRDPRFHDVFEVDVATGERHRVFANNGQFTGFVADEDLAVRVASKANPDGTVTYYRVDGQRTSPLFTIPLADAFSSRPLEMDAAGRLYLLDSRNGDKADLVGLNVKSRQQKLLVRGRRADIGEVLTDPVSGALLATREEFLQPEWTAADAKVAPDLDFLKSRLGPAFEVASQSRDDRVWIVNQHAGDRPETYHLYDRGSRNLTLLFSSKPELAARRLAETKPVLIKSRDGLDLVSYVTLPAGADTDGDGVPDRPIPLVLDVHGGPWGRDTFGFDSEHQWLANRGYAVISVNFRGSTGFGKSFISAGDREWAGKMHEDLLDAVDWAIKRRIADPDKVSIYGVSYGGYSALVGASFTPDRFACNVDVVGPVNLVTLFKNTPPYWVAFNSQIINRVGDPDKPDEARFLTSRSPISRIAAISRPLLVGQGKNDPRVNKSESDQLVQAMKRNGIPVTYIVYPDEGHGFQRPENRISFFAVAEQFYSGCLGGPAQPIGSDFRGSSITVEEGASNIPGLAAALPSGTSVSGEQ
jgi:dipeptidyl aminopeptidase/acylaminoacyl peptidase